MPGIEFAEVARRLSCREFADAEGLELRGGRTRCPFHDGARRFNLAIYDDAVFCHVCHRRADVVGFAAAVWNTSQYNAAVELNSKYQLGLAGETVTPEERDRREQARREARELKEMVKKVENEAWAAACEEEQAAQRAIERFTQADVDKPAFDAALRRLSDAHQRCNELQALARR